MARPDAGSISTRRELLDHLQTQMTGAYDDLYTRQRLRAESTLVKSYIMEFGHGTCDMCSHGAITPEALADVLTPDGSKDQQVRVLELAEPGFFKAETKSNDSVVSLYIDATTDTRFWLIYSMSASRALDRWLDSCVRTSARLDFVWMWPSLLKYLQDQGQFRGFGLDYDYRKFAADDIDSTTYLKMQLWGGPATEHVYEMLSAQGEFRDKVVLSKVRMKLCEPTDPERFALEDVKYRGKFSTRGTDISAHVAAMNEARNLYSKTIHEIETRCRVRWVNSTDHATLEGEAIHFEPTEGYVIPTRLFCERVLDGTAPFRLLAVCNEVSEDSYSAEAVDLHSGGTISMSVTPSRLSLAPHADTCGNSIARLYTNLQHYFDVRFAAVSDSDAVLFQPTSA